MSRRSKQPNRAKVIAFKASAETDRDILSWWEGLPDGERSETLRSIIRAFLGSAVHDKPLPMEAVPTQQIAEDTAWIRAALTELPGYLDQLAERLATAQPAVVVRETTVAPEPETRRLEDEAVQRRQDKIRRNTW